MSPPGPQTAALRDGIEERDHRDPLARFRDEFDLPDGVIYLDGNSLGPPPRRALARLEEVARREWGEDLIRSWNTHGWIDLPRRAGDKIARLVGAEPGEVLVTDSTSIDLFKLVAAALAERPGRRVIVSEARNFPTDLYMLQGLVRLLGGGYALRYATRERLAEALGDDVAVVALTQVDYRSGAMLDLAETTAAVHACGALMLWDLAHSAGAVPVDLGGAGADLAIGCGYKYLNGGPGAPAFLYVARRHQEALLSPLQGWMGHAAPFAFERDYRPAPGVERFLCGTPPVLSLAALDAALDLWEEVDMAEIRAKSMALGDLFLELVASECAGHGLEPACPLDAERRGSQVSLRHPEGYAIVQALIARGVIGDFREPDVLRFGFAPLYLRHRDVAAAVGHLAAVMAGREHERAEHRVRSAVT